jgi:hypothetical protein
MTNGRGSYAMPSAMCAGKRAGIAIAILVLNWPIATLDRVATVTLPLQR